MKIVVLAAALCCISAFAQTAPSCRLVSHYKITALPLHPARINNSSEIAGSTEDEQAATWTRRDGLHELTVPAGFSGAKPESLNEAGDIVGQVTVSATGTPQAFSYIHGNFRILSQAQSKAKGINNAGQIVIEESPGGPFISTEGKAAGTMKPLGGCCGGRVFGINNRGEVAGELNDREANYRAFIWDSRRGVQFIAAAAARSSSALTINDLGHVLLQTFSPNRIFLRENGKLTPVELSPELSSQPLALNDCDVIVGEYGTSSDYYRAFVWDKKNGFRDLTQLVDQTEGWRLESAVDINDHGEIVGTGDHGAGSDSGFLLVPTSEATATQIRKVKAK
jgi:uncharacterized membrane protein